VAHFRVDIEKTGNVALVNVDPAVEVVHEEVELPTRLGAISISFDMSNRTVGPPLKEIKVPRSHMADVEYFGRAVRLWPDVFEPPSGHSSTSVEDDAYFGASVGDSYEVLQGSVITAGGRVSFNDGPFNCSREISTVHHQAPAKRFPARVERGILDGRREVEDAP
jgi:hypothetical protein